MTQQKRNAVCPIPEFRTAGKRRCKNGLKFIHHDNPSKLDGSVKKPISALRFILRHCGVRPVRLIPQDSQALISGFLRIRLKCDFLRVHQASYHHPVHFSKNRVFWAEIIRFAKGNGGQSLPTRLWAALSGKRR